jgi:3-hydroxyisobutyrate dehydrogenase
VTDIAVVGLGNMGAPMATNLVRAGFRVTGVDVDRVRAERWASAHDAAATAPGAAGDVADVAGAVDVIITMLPTGAEVREVLTAAVAVGTREGLVAIDMSSADPVGTRELGAELAAGGVRFVDAPVSGGVPRAENGTLAIMIGGDPDTIDVVRPVLRAMGDRLFDVGGLGNGHAMKCLNNFVAGTAFVACSEALAVGERFGLDPDVMFDVMNVSTARCFNTDLVMRQHVVSGRFASGFALGLLAKDVGIADSLAASMGADAPLADLVTARLDEACDALGSDVDHTRAHEHWSR